MGVSTLRRSWMALSRGLHLIRSLGVADGWAAILALYRREPVPVRGVFLPFDESVGYHVLYSTQKIERLASFVMPGDLVFDVGAHAGLFSVLAARAGARVVAVEPDPEVVELLRHNTADLDVSVVDAALTLEEGSATLWRVAASTQTSSLIQSAAEPFGEIEPVDVRTVTYATLVDRYGAPDVVKLDIQGYESRLVPTMPLEALQVLLIEVTELDENPHLRAELTARLGEPDVVNPVYHGADLAFSRRPASGSL